MIPRRLILATSLVALLAGCATTQTPVPVADALARDPPKVL